MIDIIYEIGSWLLLLAGVSILLSAVLLLIVDSIQMKEDTPGKFDKQGKVKYTKGDNT